MATNKKISIGSVDFSAADEGKILANPNPNIQSSISPVLLDLPWDVMDFGVRSGMTGERFIQEIAGLFLATSSDEMLYIDEGNLLNMEQGTDVEVYEGAELRNRFYFESIKARQNDAFDIHAISGVGLLETQWFMGAFYKTTSVADIIADIIGSTLSYTIASRVGNQIITAPIGPMTRRRALSAVLLATGASILKDANGDILIDYNQQSDAATLDPVAAGGQRLEYSRATSVVVTEHSFYESTNATEEVLFDNTQDINVTSYTIYFDEPIQSFRADGITLDASGPYFATLTGVGVLYGVKYIHTMRDVSASTGVTGSTNEIRVADCTMITPANSLAVLDRIVNYEANVQLAQVDALVTTEVAGDLVAFVDPYDGEATGYIISMNKTLSGQDKAQLTIAENWIPSGFGNAYDSFLIVESSDINAGTWTVPAELRGKAVLIHLFSGAQGGQGGAAGGTPGLVHPAGADGYTLYERDNGWGLLEAYDEVGALRSQAGGKGGAAGAGGSSAARILAINTTLGSSYSVTLGAGGLGGAGGTVTRDALQEATVTPPSDGEYGEDSVFDGQSTAYGSTFGGIYLNLITGEVVATVGDPGTAGGDGGDGGLSIQVTDQTTSGLWPTVGLGGTGSGVNNNTGGAGGAGKAGIQYTRTPTLYLAAAGGGGGGGASVDGNGSAGSNGANSRRSWTEYNEDVGRVDVVYFSTGELIYTLDDDGYYTAASVSGAKGGAGASATTVPAQAIHRGGTGGSGGGGGGGNGGVMGSKISSSSSSSETWAGAGLGGLGGNGSQGGQGSDGFFIVYYKA